LGTGLLLCMCYCNELEQYSCVQGYCSVCYCNVLVQYSWIQCYCCVCYSNVLVQYIWVYGYCFVCVTVMCWCSTVGYRVTVCVLL